MYQQQRPTYIDPNNRRGTPTPQSNTPLATSNTNLNQNFPAFNSQGSMLSSQGTNLNSIQSNQLPPLGDPSQILQSQQPQQQQQSAQLEQHTLQQQQQQQSQQQFSTVTPGSRALDDEKVYQWIVDLCYGNDREQVLLELGKRREVYDDLPLVLWNSFGAMTALLDEIISVYPLLSPPNLTSAASNRVCNALALLQCVAAHQETRNLFLNAHIPLFLYPFLNTNSKQRPFEYLRLTSLGVIGALVKNDTPEVISFLLTTEIIPLCLRIMESSSELSKTVAIFIVQKILVDDAGLAYVCQTYERFSAVASVLKVMVEQLVNQQTSRLLKHVVRCYLRLSDNPDARKALRQCLPESLKDGTFHMALRDDAASRKCLAQLLLNLGDYEGQAQAQAHAQSQVQQSQVQPQFPTGLQRPQQQRV